MKMEKILLPFDGSSCSIDSAKYALDVAKMTGAQIIVVYCDDWQIHLSEVPMAVIEEIKKIRKDSARELLKNVDDILADQEVQYTLETVLGSPGEVLTNRAKSGEYDLIIMGSHGHSNIAGLFLGSVTHKVLTNIYCPVVIVP